MGYPNVLLNRAGLLKVVQTPDGEQVDLENSHAFAMVDHQVAHIFCIDEQTAQQSQRLLLADPAIAKVVSRDEAFCPGMGHHRAGERIALARRDAWLAYQWWEPGQAPRNVGAKCGYDPCEHLDAANPQPESVRASRGLTDVATADQAIIAATFKLPSGAIKTTDLAGIVKAAMFERERERVG